jgi:hypothetical protein
MLLLKLVLVPFFLLLVTLAGRRWGAATAGWLAGFPVVTGPILLFITFEQGPVFAANAAVSSLGAVFGVLCFSIVYARLAQTHLWPVAWVISLLVWCFAALVSWLLPPNIFWQACLSLVGLIIAPRLYPALDHAPSIQASSSLRGELAWRLVAGAALCWAVTTASSRLGSTWSGLLAVFPVLTSVLAVFTHRELGAAGTIKMLSAMVRGLYSLAAFCLALSLTLSSLSATWAFAMAILFALVVQWCSRVRVGNRD